MIQMIKSEVLDSIFLLWRLPIEVNDHFAQSSHFRLKLVIETDLSDSTSSSQTPSNDQQDHFDQFSHFKMMSAIGID